MEYIVDIFLILVFGTVIITSMKKGFFKSLFDLCGTIISIILAIIIVMDVFLFICGSLEAFPTVEQIEKGRIVYGLFLGIFVIVEALVLTRVIKNK